MTIKNVETRAEVMDAVEGMRAKFSDDLVASLFMAYGPSPARVAYALTYAYEGVHPSREAIVEYHVAETGNPSPVANRDIPYKSDAAEAAKADAEGLHLVKLQLVDGPTRVYDCFCTTPKMVAPLNAEFQYHLTDSLMMATPDPVADEQALASFRTDNDLTEEYLANCSMAAQLAGMRDEIKSMTAEQIETWAAGIAAAHANTEIADTLRQDLTTYLGINLSEFKGTDWLQSPEDLLDWTNPDVKDLLAAHYGYDLVDMADTLCTGVYPESAGIYALTEGLVGSYNYPEAVVEILETLEAQGDIGSHEDILSQIWQGDYPCSITTEHHEIVWYPDYADGWDHALLRRTSPFPVTVFDVSKLDNVTREDCLRAAEQVFGKIQDRGKGQTRGNGRE